MLAPWDSGPLHRHPLGSRTHVNRPCVACYGGWHTAAECLSVVRAGTTFCGEQRGSLSDVQTYQHPKFACACPCQCSAACAQAARGTSATRGARGRVAGAREEGGRLHRHFSHCPENMEGVNCLHRALRALACVRVACRPRDHKQQGSVSAGKGQTACASTMLP